MKKSINNLSFDEIFIERGKEVEVEEMKKGCYYLICLRHEEYKWLVKSGGIRIKLPCPVNTPYCLSSDDATFFKAALQGLCFSDVKYIFLATPNQIALLNSYISES
jgi:hypothetical protein